MPIYKDIVRILDWDSKFEKLKALKKGVKGKINAYSVAFWKMVELKQFVSKYILKNILNKLAHKKLIKFKNLYEFWSQNVLITSHQWHL